MYKKYMFDLDNTLVFTDSLNNESYNHALDCFDLENINTLKRIIRKDIYNTYPNLSSDNINEIIKIKQNYFIKNINKTKLNYKILEILNSYTKNDCILWTSADVNRAKAILNHYQLNNSFGEEIYSNKKEVSKDIEKICSLNSIKTSDILVHEDNLGIINELDNLGVKVVIVKG